MSAIDQIKTAQQGLKTAFDAYAISHQATFDAIEDFCGVKKSAPVKAPAKTRKRVISATSEGDNTAKGGTTAANKKQKPGPKKKHPDAPRKPPTGYLRFRSEAYQDVKARHPQLGPPQITTHIANIWNSLTDQQKDPYNKEYKQAKVQYDIEMTAFKDRLANQVEQVEQTPDIQVEAPAPTPNVEGGKEKEKGKESKEERKKRKKEKREQKERDKLEKEKAQKKKGVLSKEMVTASDEEGDILVN